MTEGFVLDATHGGVAVSSWVEGAPEKNVWTGVKVSGKPRAEIATWRCKRCGFLEQYAAHQTDRSQETKKQMQAVLLALLIVLIVLLVVGAVALLALAVSR
ncbi:MAG TPA: hypothetical protein VF662_13710 [Allosphingosinicella sp.]|jgi:hypothetical protein